MTAPTCQRCHGTGVIAHSDFWLSWCDCPVGRIVWDAALAKAFDATAAELDGAR